MMSAFVVAVAYLSSCIVQHAQIVREERKAVAQLQRFAVISREHEIASAQEDRQGWPPLEPRGAPMLRQLLGDDIFDRVHCVQFPNLVVAEKDLAVLSKCPRLDTLILDGTNFEDSGVEKILACGSLRILILDRTRVTDRGLARLTELNLDGLSIAGTRISDKAVQKFKRAEPLCDVIGHRNP